MSRGGREFDPRLLAKSNGSDKKRAGRLFPPDETPGWRSAGILLSQRSGDEAPRPWANIPPGLELSGANRVPVGGSRRGRGKRRHGWRGNQELNARETQARATKLNVV